MAKYKNLIVWQKADELAFRIYKLTEGFPRTEIFGLTSQLRRAALSIPTNIVEGYGRKSEKELSRFIDISLGSLAEVEYLFEFAKRLNYIKNDVSDTVFLIEEVGKLLWSFQKAVNRPEERKSSRQVGK
ncbi:MAG: four helix bundle protein [Nitrospirota bacterium]